MIGTTPVQRNRHAPRRRTHNHRQGAVPPVWRGNLVAVLAAASATLCACSAPETAQLPAEWHPALSSFAETVAADMESDSVGGITVALARDGEVLWSEAFGWADPEAGIPAARETIYRTGSISKSFTAVLLAILVDDGTVSLEQTLESLVPEIAELRERPPGADPVLRQVASHTAGFGREPGLPGAATGPIEAWTERILESIPTTRYLTPPGTEYSYSNIGFGILGFAMERAAGEPFMDQVEARIFEPLEMESSTFIVGDALRPMLSKGHANNAEGDVNTERPAQEHLGRGYKVPNGGVYSTVDDLAAFAAGVMGRGGASLLSDEMRAAVLSVQTPEDPDSGYGLGFSITTLDGRVFAGHGGSVAGYTAHLLFEPATGLTAVLLRNYNRGRTNLGRAARELLAGLPVG
ncbi:MAG: serine hydrolase [Gemmatimonadota bacterium]|nr:serine hydrolase [Gemmatimonadota bacterium]